MKSQYGIPVRLELYCAGRREATSAWLGHPTSTSRLPHELAAPGDPTADGRGCPGGAAPDGAAPSRRAGAKCVRAEAKGRATMKGDRVEIVIDAGSGTTRSYDVVATRAGRRVTITHSRGTIEVSEVTRGGSTVRTARFLANRVLALVEHPAADDPTPDEITPTLRTA
jgi:hypothetical protein